jgi:hypothetical protein
MMLIMRVELYTKNVRLIYTVRDYYYSFGKPVNPCIQQTLAVCSPVICICDHQIFY